MADNDTLNTQTQANAGTYQGTNTSTPAQSTSAPQETPQKDDARSKEQKEKHDNAVSDGYVGEKFLNYAFACIDEDEESYTVFNNEQSLKIVCLFVPKFKKGEDIVNPEDIIKLPYSEVVKEIILDDKLDSIGVTGSIIVSNTGSILEGVFERHNNYYLVINITEQVGSGSIKYEPYICDITSVQNITKSFKKEKLVKINFCDIITSILSSHSIASFIKFEGQDITKCRSYKQLFEKIINYVKRFIRINTDNYWEYKKDVLYGESTYFDGYKKINGFDADLDLGELITASFNKIGRNASIYEALQVFLRDCVTSIKMTDEMKAVFEEIGDVLIPFFFKEEYADVNAVYYSLWNEGDPAKIEANNPEPVENEQTTQSGTPQPESTPTGSSNGSQPATAAEEQPQPESTDQDDTSTMSQLASSQPQQAATTSNAATTSSKKDETQEEEDKATSTKEMTITNYGGKSAALALRHITMRDFFMPFYLCFTYRGAGLPFVWEDINQGEYPVATLNGNIQDNLQSLTFKSIEKTSVDKHWKNAIFLDASAEASGCNCTLVFFDWFYRFFLKAFLNSSLVRTAASTSYVSNGDEKRYISNVIPDFYFFSLLNKVGFAENSSDQTFNNLFDEYNSYTVALTTTDTLNESLREMGKNIASLVLLNDSYSFSLKGNILRRPNEIMRLNIGDLYNGGDSQLNIFPNLSGDSSLYVYVKKVSHIFRGSEYVTGIVASKICESL